MSKRFAERVGRGLMDAWILVRVIEKKTAVLIPQMGPDGKITDVRSVKRAINQGVVVDVGPGERSPTTGARIPVDERIRQGATVVFFGSKQGAYIPPDFQAEFEAEGLLCIAESAVVFTLEPEGTPQLARAR